MPCPQAEPWSSTSWCCKYLKATEESLKAGADKLRFDEKPLEDKTLYLCFRDDEQGRKLKHIFNAGPEGVDAEAIVDNWINVAALM